MNFNTLSGSAKLYKKLEIAATGQTTASGEVPNIAILCAVDQFENQKLIASVASGVKAKNGIVTVIPVPSFGYFKKVNPMTAKYAASFINTSASNAEAIIKCGLYDGIVIVADCDITAIGILEGAARANCPALILSIGTCFGANRDKANYQIQGLLTGGKINARESESLIQNAISHPGIPNNYNSVSTFFILAEAMGLSVPNASLTRINSASHLRNAISTGEQICENAKSILAPKKFLTRSNLGNAIAVCLAIGGDISAINFVSNLVKVYEKIQHEIIAEYSAKTALLVSHENQNCEYILKIGGISGIVKQLSATPKFIDETALTYTGEKLKQVLANTTASELPVVSKTARIIFAKGSACDDGGYAQPIENTPVSISGKAWVYTSLEDADKALCSGSIPNGSVIVVHNCPDTYVSSLCYTIESLNKQIAVVTDGLCDKTSALVITRCTPNSLSNEAFANIQNGDTIDIDLGRGRINTSATAKDIKTRAKKNSIRKQTVYFQ